MNNGNKSECVAKSHCETGLPHSRYLKIDSSQDRLLVQKFKAEAFQGMCSEDFVKVTALSFFYPHTTSI